MNDEGLEEKVDEALKLSKENNKMLRKMYHHMQWSRVFHVFYWILVIGSAVGAYYFFQPYIDGFKSIYNRFGDQVENVSNFLGGDKNSTQQ